MYVYEAVIARRPLLDALAQHPLQHPFRLCAYRRWVRAFGIEACRVGDRAEDRSNCGAGVAMSLNQRGIGEDVQQRANVAEVLGALQEPTLARPIPLHDLKHLVEISVALGEIGVVVSQSV